MVFGGGLVGGDVINIEYHIGSQSAALVTSQESTKVSSNSELRAWMRSCNLYPAYFHKRFLAPLKNIEYRIHCWPLQFSSLKE